MKEGKTWQQLFRENIDLKEELAFWKVIAGFFIIVALFHFILLINC